MEVMGNDLSRGLFPVKEVKLLNSLRWALLLAMSLANRFKDLYQGQLFNFWSSAFFLKISLLEMLIAVGNEHLKKVTHRGASVSPADHPDKVVLVGRAALHSERSSTVALASVFPRRTRTNHFA